MTAAVATAPQAAVSAIANYGAATQQLRARVLRVLLGLWDGYSAYRDAQADAFVAAAVPTVSGGQQAMAALTSAYLAQLDATMALQASQVPAAVSRTVLEGLRGGTPPQEVYRRPFVTLWTDLSQGKAFDAAQAAGRRRLVDVASTDLQLAKTHQSLASMSTMGDVVGYRRVLTGSHSCGMCVIAATQRYRKSDLMPIHPGCDCAVAPIYGHHDPGRTVDAGVLSGQGVTPSGMTAHGVPMVEAQNVGNLGDVLGDVHQAIEARFGASDAAARLVDYRKALVTHDHGEIGPVLALKDQTFSGPSELHLG